MTPGGTPSGRTGLAGAVERLVTLWALVGGLALVAIVAINVLEVASTVTLHLGLTGRFAGAVELTAILAATAAFCFLPYAQITDANVTADIFTARAGPRTVAVLKAAGAAVAIGFGLFLMWRMSEGLADQRARGLRTAILAVPIWPAYLAAVISLALVALAAAVTLWEAGRTALGRGRQ